MNIHFIAIGGSAMHNLAIALHNKGYQVTGSDDTIHDDERNDSVKHHTDITTSIDNSEKCPNKS